MKYYRLYSDSFGFGYQANIDAAGAGCLYVDSDPGRPAHHVNRSFKCVCQGHDRGEAWGSGVNPTPVFEDADE